MRCNSLSQCVAASLLMLASATVTGASQTGNVYPIIEPDALVEMQERAARVDHAAIFRAKKPEDWRAYQGIALPRAVETATRLYTPLYTTQFPITDETGRQIYPSGFEFNPLDHVSMPYRIIVLDESDIDWLLAHVTDTDLVVVTGGDYQKVSQALGRPAFLIEEKMIARLGLQAVPVIVEQQGNQYQLSEYAVLPDMQASRHE